MNIYKLGLLASSILILTACGGGGGSDSPNNPQTPTNPQPSITTNKKPIANAGYDQNIEIGSYLGLVGKGSDADNDPLTYHWSVKEKPSQSNVVLSKISESESRFTPDVQGQYVIQLIVNDGKEDSNPSTIKVNVKQATPVANAGTLQNITLGDILTLDGSKSYDYDKDYITYNWTIESKPSNSNLAIPSSEIYKVNPMLTPDVQGKYVFGLRVHDGKVFSTKSTVEVNVVKGNSAPVAKIQEVSPEYKVGSKVILNSSSTDVDGDSLTYNWVLESKPEKSVAQLSLSTTHTPTIILDGIGTYKVSLIVNDGKANSNKDTITLKAIEKNSAPIAVIDTNENQTFLTKTSYGLEGNNSYDPDNDRLTYQWSIVSKPTNSTQQVLYGNDKPKATLIADVAGTYVFSLIVRDGETYSKPTNIVIDVIDKPEIILSNKPSGGSYNFFPYHTQNMNFNSSLTCGGEYCNENLSIHDFYLLALGGNFTIIDLKARSSNSDFPAYFENLKDNQIVNKDQVLKFSLRFSNPSKKTGYTFITYSFSIKETGQTFHYSIGGTVK